MSLSITALSCAMLAQSAETGEVGREELALLQKTQGASQKLNYSGVFVYQQGNQIRTSRITHMPQAAGSFEKLEILDGSPREYIRRDSEVTSYLPESKTIQIEKNADQAVFPALLSGNIRELSEYYRIRIAGSAWVAGIECTTVTLEPKDKTRYGYRLCIDKATGLLLRAQTLGSQNEPLEQIAFTQISVGHVEKSQFKPSFPNSSQWSVEQLSTPVNQVSGWEVKTLPTGFKKIRELKRIMHSPANNTNTQQQRQPYEVVQIVYSDGLSAISIFIEPDTRGRAEGSLQQGATAIVGKRKGNVWLTVVGEAPLPAIMQVANSIEYKPK